MAASAEGQFDAVVAVTVPVHPCGDAGSDQEVDGVLFEDSGTVGLFDLPAAAQIDHDRVDPGAGQQVGEHESGRAGSDDADLRAASDA